MIILGAIIVVFLSVFAVGAVIINMEDKNWTIFLSAFPAVKNRKKKSVLKNMTD